MSKNIDNKDSDSSFQGGLIVKQQEELDESTLSPRIGWFIHEVAGKVIVPCVHDIGAKRKKY